MSTKPTRTPKKRIWGNPKTMETKQADEVGRLHARARHEMDAGMLGAARTMLARAASQLAYMKTSKTMAGNRSVWHGANQRGR